MAQTDLDIDLLPGIRDPGDWVAYDLLGVT